MMNESNLPQDRPSGQSTGIEKARACCNPMHFATEVDGTEIINGGGSFFIICYKYKYYIVTALHVLAGRKDEELMFNDFHHGSEPIICRSRITIQPTVATDDTDFTDLALFPIDMNSLTAEHQHSIRGVAAVLPDSAKYRTPGSRLLCYGYPRDYLNDGSVGQCIDYEREHIALRLQGMEAKWVGKTESQHVIKAMAVADRNFSGMSGGPVFSIDDHFIHELAGVLIRGSTSTTGRNLRFIHASVLLEAIKQDMQQNSTATP